MHGALETVRNLQTLRELLKTSEAHNTHELARHLWRHGWPSRVIELPSDWWEQTCELESGLWIVTEQQSPEHWWLVHQRQGTLKIHALTAAKGSQSNPHDLQRQAVSLWPAMDFSSPARWSDLQRQLKPGPSIRAALPAALLRALTWLILPLLLIAMLKQISWRGVTQRFFTANCFTC